MWQILRKEGFAVIKTSNTLNFSIFILLATFNLLCAKTYAVSTNEELVQVNNEVRPGDTVILNPGIFSVPIRPVQSGAADRPITYQSLINGTASFNGDSLVAINLSNRSYIKIKGIKVENVLRFIIIEEGDHHDPSPLELYCDANPSEPECLVYED